MSALTSPAACPDVTLLTRASGSYLEISNTSVAHGYLRLSAESKEPSEQTECELKAPRLALRRTRDARKVPMSALTSPAACPDVTLLTRASGSYLEISNTSVAHGYLRLLLTFGVACAFDRFGKSHHYRARGSRGLGWYGTGREETKTRDRRAFRYSRFKTSMG